MDNNQIKTNAIISYMFLGWIFLMAKSNPNFEHEFIKKHAWKATKIHFIFLIVFATYNFFLSSYFYITIPFLFVSVDKIINLIIFSLLTISILKGCYNAYKGFDPENISLKKIYTKNTLSYDIKNFSENEKMICLSSLFPFLGIISSKNYENNFTKTGVKIGSILTFLMSIYIIFNGFDSIFLLLLFIYIITIVYYGVNIFINEKFSFPVFLEKIPSTRFLSILLKAGVFYCIDFLKLVSGKNKILDFKSKILEISKKDQEYENSLKEYYTNEKLILPKIFIYIPIVNLLFLSNIFKFEKNKYFLAIIQGIIISAILILIWFIYGFRSKIEILMLFPIFLGIANISFNSFYRIPLIYEIFKILNTLSFGLLGRIKTIKEKNIEMKEIRLKV